MISVIIPTYKHRNFVIETINSVLAQSFRDFEVIVINDGSPDDTAELLKPLHEKGLIRFIDQPNAGAASARNRGLSEARGDYIAFLDDDDLWPPDKLEWQFAFLDANPDVGVIGGSLEVLFAETGEIQKVDCDEGLFDRLRVFDECPFVSPGQALFRKSVLQSLDGFDPSIWGADDYDLYFRLLLTHRLFRKNQTALRYRNHAGNASKSTRRMLKGCREVILRHLPSFPADVRADCRRRAFRFLYMYTGRHLAAGVNHNALRFKLPSAWSDLIALKPFVGPAFRDGELFYWLIKDVFIPQRLRSSLKLRLARS